MLFGSAQRKPKGLFGGFAPSSGQQMPRDDPMGGAGMGMQQAMQQAPAQMMGQGGQQFAQEQAPKKPGINWWGVVADALAGAAGKEGPWAAQMQVQRQQEAAREHAQQQREASMQDWRTKFDIEQQYKRENPDPSEPWEDNAGNRWRMGPDGQPQLIFTDKTLKQYMTPGGIVSVPNVYAGGGAPDDDEWGPVVNQRPGGASGNAGGNFPRY